MGSGLDLDLLDDMGPSALSTGAPKPGTSLPIPAVNGTQSEDLGFKLSIEGHVERSPAPARPNLVASSALPAIEVNSMAGIDDAVPELGPHRDPVPDGWQPRPQNQA